MTLTTKNTSNAKNASNGIKRFNRSTFVKKSKSNIEDLKAIKNTIPLMKRVGK
jgi:hypothetical protein